jgi:O-antigen ligase
MNFISAVISEYPITAFDNLRRLFTAYTFFALTLIFVTNKGFTKTLPVILILGISISSLLSVAGYLFDIPLFIINIQAESVKRGQGASYDPNYFSVMLTFSLPLLAHFYFSSRRAFKKVIIAGLFVLNITSVILTYSRGGAIILAVVLTFLLLEYIRRLRPRYFGFITSAALIAILSIAILVPGSYWERQKSVKNTVTDTAISRRISYLNVGWDAFKENPVLGSGPGTFKEIYADSIYAIQYRKEGKSGRRVAHNAYLEVIVGSGLPGIILYCMIIIFTFKNFYASERRFNFDGRKEMASLVRAYRLSFIVILLAFFTLSANYLKYFWLSIGLSQVALLLLNDGKEEKPGVDFDSGD